MNNNTANIKTNLISTLKILCTSLIWASTFVLARMAIEEMGPITLGGLRFFFAGLILLIYLRAKKFEFSTLKGQWFNLLALGLLSFTIGNAAIYYALQFLPSTTVSLLMNFVTPVVLIFGAIWLNEIPSKIQYAGIVLALAGTVAFFHPQQIPISNPGFPVIIMSLFAFGGYTILGRFMARDGKVHYMAQTTFPLLFGGAILLVIGFIVEGIPTISLRTGLILIWLTVVNSIVGYILYNQAIVHLTAIKINVVLNLSPFFTAIIAFFLLGERISRPQIIAMAVIFAGTYLVQSNSGKIVKKDGK